MVAEASTDEPVRSEDRGHRQIGWKESGEEVFHTVGDVVDVAGLVALELPIGTADLSLHFQTSGFAPKQVWGLTVTDRPDPEPVTIELSRGVEVRLEVRGERPFDREVRANHLLFLLEQSQLAALRGPFAEQGGPSNWRINGVNMWVGEPGLMAQMPEFDDDGNARAKGLGPGRYRLKAFPDDLRFDPDAFTVGDADRSVALRWRNR